MVNSVIKSTFETTYRDDWTDSDNFYKILFNNGRSLQARELTSLQSILQNQITKNSNYLFNQGAAIDGGALSLSTNVEYVKLDTTVYSLPSSTASMIQDIFTGSSSGVKVRLDRLVVAAGTDPTTLYVSYVDNNNAVVTDTTTAVRLIPGETIVGINSAVTLKVQTANTVINPALGAGTILSIAEGTFYAAGLFVYCPAQSLVLSKYTSTATAEVGLVINESIITASDNEILYDNSGPNPNFSAPGADRYKVQLILTTKAAAAASDAFITVASIVNGAIVSEKTKDAQDTLNVIGDVFAKRTYEESGNYIVKPFIILPITNDSDGAQLNINVGEGIAYVEGYRIENLGTRTYTIDKPRTTETLNNQVTAANYGNYIKVENLKGVPLIGTWDILNLRSDIGYNGITIGTARIRSIERDGPNYKMYLFDIVMDSGQKFRDVKSIGESYVSYADLILANDIAKLFDTANNNLLFDLQTFRPQQLSDIVLTVQRIYTATTDGSGNATITSSAGEAFDDAGSWIVTVDVDGAIVTPSISVATPYTSAVLSGLPNSENITIAAYVLKSNGSTKSKTVTPRATVFTPELDNSVKLDRADIISVISIKEGSSSGTDITYKYIVDNGQRDNFYDIGRLYLKAGESAPAGNVHVDFTFFAHGASGDFFAVNSYIGQVDYENIPSFKQANGEIVQLRDTLDFRPRKDNTGSNFTGVGASKVALPRNTDLIIYDAINYQFRRGIVVLNKTTGIDVILGQASITNPQWPSIPPGCIDIYRFTLNPYMVSETDMSSKYVEYKLYTMADIGKIENRLDKIEEMTSLTLLELETANLQSLDSNGIDRLKAGFTADPFKDHSFSDTTNREYRAAIDFVSRELRPSFSQKSIELVYDQGASIGTSLVGDTVYMDYTEELWKQSTQVSRTVPVTTFEVSKMVGEIKLSPATDTWFDTETLPKKIVDGGVDLDVDNAKGWSNWNWNWSGYSDDELSTLSLGAQLQNTSTSANTRTYSANGSTYVVKDKTTYTNKISSEYTVKESLGTFERYRTSIPYQRSKFVFFRATNLKPNTRFFAFFGDRNVSDWINTNTAFQYYGALDRNSVYLEVGNIYKKEVGFPIELGGPTTIYSDGVGKIEGVFLVPSTSSIKIPSGNVNFTFIDISELNLNNTLSYASADFNSTGVPITNQEEILSTRKLKVVGSTANAGEDIISTTPNAVDNGGTWWPITVVRGIFNFIGNIFSDDSLKERVYRSTNPIEKLGQLEVFDFKYTDIVHMAGVNPEYIRTGTSAQQMAKIYPQAVEATELNGKTVLMVNYAELVPDLIDAIAMQQKQIKELTDKINEMGSK